MPVGMRPCSPEFILLSSCSGQRGKGAEEPPGMGYRQQKPLHGTLVPRLVERVGGGWRGEDVVGQQNDVSQINWLFLSSSCGLGSSHF